MQKFLKKAEILAKEHIKKNADILKKTDFAKKAEILKLRDKKNIKTFEKKASPYIQHLIRLGVSPELLTTFGLLFVLIAGVFILEGWLFLGGVFVLLAGLSQFLDGLLARTTNMERAMVTFYSSLADRFGDLFLLFSIVVYGYARNYPLILIAMFLIILITMNNYLVLTARAMRISKKIEMPFYRPEFMAFLSLGLIFNLLNLFMMFSLLFAGYTTYTIAQEIRAWFGLGSKPKKKQ